ncbi:MAG: PDZ domain-containing protein [Thermomicrobiales bacterium]
MLGVRLGHGQSDQAPGSSSMPKDMSSPIGMSSRGDKSSRSSFRMASGFQPRWWVRTASSDLAVVRIDGEAPTFATFGNSDEVAGRRNCAGDRFTVGHLHQHRHQGIVSALGRDLAQSNYNNLIQHDAAISLSSSGGPLFDLHGRVVGVNTLGVHQKEGGQSIQGLFFAARQSGAGHRAAADFRWTRDPPFFGIASDHQRQLLPRPIAIDIAAYISVVNIGGPAEAAGLQVGDIVIAINGVSVNEQNAFAEVLFMHQPGETVSVDVLRGDQMMTVQLTLIDVARRLSEDWKAERLVQTPCGVSVPSQGADLGAQDPVLYVRARFRVRWRSRRHASITRLEPVASSSTRWKGWACSLQVGSTMLHGSWCC